MADTFLGEIRMFAGNFPPSGWAFCDGQLLPVAQYAELFALFGTRFGGDGESEFALPDMRGRVPVHQGVGPSLTSRRLGAVGGVEHVTLSQEEMAEHGHAMAGGASLATSQSPKGAYLARTAGIDMYNEDDPPVTSLHAQALSTEGEGEAHENMQPFLCVHFIVALRGAQPERE